MQWLTAMQKNSKGRKIRQGKSGMGKKRIAKFVTEQFCNSFFPFLYYKDTPENSMNPVAFA